MPNNYFILYIIFFCFYFILHSILSSLRFKKFIYASFPKIKPYYRLLFNVLSTLLLIPFALLLFLFPGDSLWKFEGVGAYLANGIAITAMIGFYLSLSDYDMGEFWGVKQISEQHKSLKISYKEQFFIGDFHRYVRHPWYFFLLLILWTRDMTVYSLLTAVLITFYLIIGSYLEEKKLIACYGNVYRQYKQSVAGLIPLPWKTLTKQQAEQIIQCC